jgi:hypothetical protein
MRVEAFARLRVNKLKPPTTLAGKVREAQLVYAKMPTSASMKGTTIRYGIWEPEEKP